MPVSETRKRIWTWASVWLSNATDTRTLPRYAQLLSPFGRLLRLSPLLIKSNDLLSGLLQAESAGSGNCAYPLCHPCIAGKQQRFGLGVFLLTGETGAQQALSVVSNPGVGAGLLVVVQRFAEQCLGLGVLSLVGIGLCVQDFDVKRLGLLAGDSRRRFVL